MKQKFFDLARRLSKHSTHHQHRHGCVIVDKNRVISVGFNKDKTHTKSIHKWNFLHAEISALIGLEFEKTKGCTAYIYREDKSGNPAMSRPCEACFLALKLAGIKRIFYSIHNNFMEEKLT